MKPDKAFILAAGLGTRLRPYTDTLPKPMVPVAGVPIIDRALDHLQAEGVRQVVVNLHHKAESLEQHLSRRTMPEIIFSPEETLLNTGGGIKKALHYFGETPFYVLNGDALWSNGANETALQRLAQGWDAQKMDLLLLLMPKASMSLTKGVGDYKVAQNGQAIRCPDLSGTHMFAGIRIVHPRLFADTPDGAFSFLSLMDRAQDNGRLFAVVHDGDWHHISTPEELDNVARALGA